MTAPDLFTVFLLAAVCVPLSWAMPRRFAFDAVAAWTLACLFFLSPASAIWLLAIAVALPLLLPLGTGRKGGVAALICIALVACLVGARVTPGWAWIGGAFFTLRGLHIVAEWWMGRLAAPGYRESLHYFLFLPVLASGPINRLPHFRYQLLRRRWEPEMVLTGAERILMGLVWLYLVAGIVIARLQAEVAHAVRGMTEFLQVWIASAVSWVELFFVFAGATHVALGISLMMGLKLEENFNRPWTARSLPEFWTRWHMSLTGWVQDYVFRPASALTRQPVLAVIAAMLVIGLWHELSLYYVLWSFWQSLGIILSRLPVLGRTAGRLPDRLAAVLGPVGVLAWLSAAKPVIGILLGTPP